MKLLTRLVLVGSLAAVLAAADGVPESLSGPYRKFEDGIQQLDAKAKPFGIDLDKQGMADLRGSFQKRMVPLAGIHEVRTLADDARVREVQQDLERCGQQFTALAEQIGNNQGQYKELPAADLEAIGKGMGQAVHAVLADLVQRLSEGLALPQQAQRQDRDRFQTSLRILFSVRQGSRQIEQQLEQQNDQLPVDPALLKQMRSSADRVVAMCVQGMSTPTTNQPGQPNELPYQIGQMGDQWSRAWRACLQRQSGGQRNEVPALPALVAAQRQAESAVLAAVLVVEKQIAASLAGEAVVFPDNSEDEPLNQAVSKLEQLHEIAQTWASFEQIGGKLGTLPVGLRQNPQLKPIIDGLEARRLKLMGEDPLAKLGSKQQQEEWMMTVRSLREQYQELISPMVELAENGSANLARIADLPAGDPGRVSLDAFITCLSGMHQSVEVLSRIEIAQHQLQRREELAREVQNQWQSRFWDLNNRLQQDMSRDPQGGGDAGQGGDPQAIVDALPEDPAPPKPGF